MVCARLACGRGSAGDLAPFRSRKRRGAALGHFRGDVHEQSAVRQSAAGYRAARDFHRAFPTDAFRAWLLGRRHNLARPLLAGRTGPMDLRDDCCSSIEQRAPRAIRHVPGSRSERSNAIRSPRTGSRGPQPYLPRACRWDAILLAVRHRLECGAALNTRRVAALRRPASAPAVYCRAMGHDSMACVAGRRSITRAGLLGTGPHCHQPGVLSTAGRKSRLSQSRRFAERAGPAVGDRWRIEPQDQSRILVAGRSSDPARAVHGCALAGERCGLDPARRRRLPGRQSRKVETDRPRRVRRRRSRPGCAPPGRHALGAPRVPERTMDRYSRIPERPRRRRQDARVDDGGTAVARLVHRANTAIHQSRTASTSTTWRISRGNPSRPVWSAVPSTGVCSMLLLPASPTAATVCGAGTMGPRRRPIIREAVRRCRGNGRW